MNGEFEQEFYDMHAEEIAGISEQDVVITGMIRKPLAYRRASATTLNLCDTRSLLTPKQNDALERDLQILARQARRPAPNDIIAN